MSGSFQAKCLLLILVVVSNSPTADGQRNPRTRQSTASATSNTPALQNRLELKARGIALRYPSNWSSPPQRYPNMNELINLQPGAPDSETPTSRIEITVVTRRSHEEAVRELREIVSENDSTPTFLSLGGWPALQRRH